MDWKTETSSCTEQLAKGQLGLDRRAESILQNFARTSLPDNIKNNEAWEESVRAEGRAIRFIYRLKKPMDTDAFNCWVGLDQKIMRDAYCADGSWLLRSLGATETHTFYSVAGGRLTSFSIAPADCTDALVLPTMDR
jgi:hypothetical protein